MTEAEALPGQAVTDGRGSIGIITELPRKAGIYRGKASVMWIGGRHTVTELPEELSAVTVEIRQPGPEGQQK